MKRLAKYMLARQRKARASKAPALAPRLLIFDFDGTLADTFRAGFEILNKLSSEFDFRLLSEEDIEIVRDMGMRQVLKYLGIRPTKMAKIARRGSEELSLRIQGVQPLQGVLSVVRELHARGFQIGILTSNSQENVQIFLNNHDLNIFDFVRSSSKLMGKAREIKAIRKKLGVPKNEILLIGDEMRDIEAAHKDGVAIAAVVGGYNSRQALEKVKPQYLLDRPEDLLTLLRQPGEAIS